MGTIGNGSSMPDLPPGCLDHDSSAWPVWWVFTTGVGVGMCMVMVCYLLMTQFKSAVERRNVWAVAPHGTASPHGALNMQSNVFVGEGTESPSNLHQRHTSYTPPANPHLIRQMTNEEITQSPPAQQNPLRDTRVGGKVSSPTEAIGNRSGFPSGTGLNPGQPLFVGGGSLCSNNSVSRSPPQRSPQARRGGDMQEASAEQGLRPLAGSTFGRTAEFGYFPVHPQQSFQGPLYQQTSFAYDSPRSPASFSRRNTGMHPSPQARRRRTVIGSWTKGKLLGQGASGKVYMGVKDDGSLLAVKVLDLMAMTDASQTTSLSREIDLLSSLTHERIVDYYGCKIDDRAKELHIMMEYVSNGSLGHFVRSMSSNLPEATVANYTVQILEGVQYLHEHQIVHRDLKGDNILLTHEGECKISDFGTSKSMVPGGDYAGIGDAGAGMTSYKVAGTPLWSAPEVFQGTYTFKSDMWSLGCVVCEMLTKRPPWPEFETVWSAIGTIMKCKGYPPLMPTASGEKPIISPEGEAFLKLCFAFKPEQRATATDLLEDEWLAMAAVQDEDDEEEAFQGGVEKDIDGKEIYTPIYPHPTWQGSEMDSVYPGGARQEVRDRILHRIAELHTPHGRSSKNFPDSPRERFKAAAQENFDNSVSTPTNLPPARRSNVVMISESQITSTHSSSGGEDQPPCPIYKRGKSNGRSPSSGSAMLQASIGMNAAPSGKEDSDSDESSDAPPVSKRRQKGRLSHAGNMLANSVGIDANTLSANVGQQGVSSPNSLHVRQSSLRKSPTGAQATMRGSVSFPQGLGAGQPGSTPSPRHHSKSSTPPRRAGSKNKGSKARSPMKKPPPTPPVNTNDSSESSSDCAPRQRRRPKGGLSGGRNMLMDSVQMDSIPKIDSGESVPGAQ
eukprot:TRINITY_DN3043_c0_g1_i1.p1 TRINITY_DN3043_c0_g1~~TRINITY_DN3043_c0_g1_i1.p1  ORF type:complete len:896 (+),score=248.72 TRINITY_DN3043_c0_g1_i1:132-2819(+)